MDFDVAPDHNFIKIREKLNQDQIKLWLPPFLNENQDKNLEELQKLADSFSRDLSIPRDTCLSCIEQLQAKALENLRERNNFRTTGKAALKVRVPNVQSGCSLTINIELSKNGFALREEISKAIGIPLERLKVIFKGKVLKDEEVLESQGIKHGLHMMAIVLKENSDSAIPNYESHVKQLDSTKADIELCSKSDYFQVADQSGKLLKLPSKERESLILAMTLHEKGRAALKKEDFALALIMLLEAEKEFCQCNSSLLKRVDNYGVLSLDIVWCYLNLQSVTQLPDAEERLRQCEQNFQQSYGSNLERLAAVKGFTGNESALFMRLHLMQAIVLYHQNRIEQARELLKKAEDELKNLEIDDSQLSHLIELGYGTKEARLALRAAHGDINIAVSIIEHKKAEKKKNEEMEALEKKLLSKKKKLGKCMNGEWIEPQLHSTLMSMGFSYELSRWALAHSNNNISSSVNLINENPLVPKNFSFDNTDGVSKDLLNEVINIGFDPKMAKLALKKHKGDTHKAVEELVANGGIISDISYSSSDSDSDNGGEDSTEDGPSTSQLKKKRDEAFTRLKEGISNTEDDHLDLNLVPEAVFLNKYKELLSKR